MFLVEEKMEGGDKNGVIVVKKQKMKLENPFNFKVLQVFTGFGVGCGVGIGRGLPINLGNFLTAFVLYLCV